MELILLVPYILSSTSKSLEDPTRCILEDFQNMRLTAQHRPLVGPRYLWLFYIFHDQHEPEL